MECIVWLSSWRLAASYSSLTERSDATVADRMCRSGAVDLICIDSVSALTPRAEIEVRDVLAFFLILGPHNLLQC